MRVNKRDSDGCWLVQPVEERFAGKWTPAPSGCWTWTDTLDADGYGYFWFEGKRWRAARFSYATHVGPIADGHEIDHTCRNRACVNPEHLEAVTPHENHARSSAPDVLNARKTHCPAGHPYNEANTYRARGRRYCRECGREACREYHRRRIGYYERRA